MPEYLTFEQRRELSQELWEQVGKRSGLHKDAFLDFVFSITGELNTMSALVVTKEACAEKGLSSDLTNQMLEIISSRATKLARSDLRNGILGVLALPALVVVFWAMEANEWLRWYRIIAAVLVPIAIIFTIRALLVLRFFRNVMKDAGA